MRHLRFELELPICTSPKQVKNLANFLPSGITVKHSEFWSTPQAEFWFDECGLKRTIPSADLHDTFNTFMKAKCHGGVAATWKKLKMHPLR